MTKGPIYRTEDAICSPELLKQLRDAIVELEEKMKASAPIMDGKIRRGWVDVGVAVTKKKPERCSRCCR